MTESKPQQYPYFGVPPARQPRPAAKEPTLTGKRVVLSTPEGFVYDMRAASEPDGKGGVVIPIVTDANCYAGKRTGTPWPQHLVWVE